MRLPVVHLNCQAHFLVMVVDHFVQQGVYLDVVGGLQAGEAALVLEVALEIEFLCFQALDSLRGDHLKLIFFIFLLVLLLYFRNG